MKKYKKPQKFLKVQKVMKCNKEIWQEQTNGEDRNKNVKVKKKWLQLSNVIKICTKGITFLGMTNLEGDNIRRRNISKTLPSKLLPLTKGAPMVYKSSS